MALSSLAVSEEFAVAVEKDPETRAYLVAHSKAFSPESIAEEIRTAARAGFNVIVFPVYNNGFTLFPSETARAAKMDPINPAFKQWNPLEVAIETADSCGLSVWGFSRPYNFHPRHSVTPHKLLNKFPEWRIRVHPDQRHATVRQREQYIACPVNPDYRHYLSGVLVELVAGYPIGGLALAYGGYGLRTGTLEDHPFCFCSACAKQYAEDRDGRDLEEDARDPERMQEIRKWQTEISNEGFEYLRHRMTSTRRSLRLLCRVHPHWRWRAADAGPSMHAPYCIDWNRLLQRGSVEALIVDHDDEVAPEVFSTRVNTDLCELHHEALLLPSLKIERPDELGPALEAVHRYPVSGLLVELRDPISPETAGQIRRKYFRHPADPVEETLLPSAVTLLSRVRDRHRDNPLISDFIRDFLRLLQGTGQGANFSTLRLVFENLAGLQDAIRRGKLKNYHVPEETLRDIGLARRLIRLAGLDARA